MMQSADMYSPANTVHDNLISNLESTFRKSFHIEDVEKLEHSFVGGDYCDTWKGVLIQQEKEIDKTCLRGSANARYSNKTLPSSSSDEELVMTYVIQANTAKTHLKPVSAMKGSREKQGGSRTKLAVKWSPDVYDPMPGPSSLSVKSKRQHKSRGKKSEKKNGKGQMNTCSGRVSSKDKKHYSRSIGTADKCYKLLDSCNGLIGSSTELDTLYSHQDSFCGTRLFKQSVTLVPRSVAEA